MTPAAPSLFDALDDIALIIATDGRLLEANPAARRQLADPAAATPLAAVLGVTDPQHALARISHGSEDVSYEGPVPRLPDRTWRVRATALAGGTSLVTLRDVTRLKELQDAVVRSHHLAAVGGLIGGVAHELNNPLASVLGFAELIVPTPGLDPTIRHHLEIIRDEARRAAKIVKNLLIFSRPTTDRAVGQLNDAVSRVTELMAADLRRKGSTLALQLDPNLSPIVADHAQIQQILFNLLRNALQACPSPGGRITVSTREEGSDVELSVADNGPGIPEPVKARLFQPFFTTKAAGSGSGLGLWLCDGIVRDHGGQLLVDSPPGAGATFRVRLPRQGPSPSRHMPSSTQVRAARGLRILVVDDEPTATELIRHILGDGNTITLCSNGANALDAMKANAYDVVITDLVMLGISGRELYRRIVKDFPALAKRIIFVTGDVASTDTRAFFRDADLPVVTKPFKARDLMRAVMKVINPS
jgi:two-component system NtrC family sensor kinase